MYGHILLVSPDEDFTRHISDSGIILESDEIKVIAEAQGRQQIIREVESPECVVVVGKELSLSLIPASVPVPKIPVYVDPFDLLCAIHEAAKLYRRIAYIGFWKEAAIYDFSLMATLAETDIIPLPMRHRPEIPSLVEQACAQEAEMVICSGPCIARICQTKGIPAEVIYPGKRSIKEAFTHAREVLLTQEINIRHARQLSAIIDSVGDGIVAIDDDGKVVIANPAARKLLNLSEEMIGKNVRYWPTDAPIRRVYQMEHHDKGMCSIGGYTVVVDRQQTPVGEQSYGTLITLRDITEVQKLEQQIRSQLVKKGMTAKTTFDDLVGTSSLFRQAVEAAKRFAQSDSTVLITGESGTGKELFAQSIHNASPRRNGPFVGINCAALPESLLDSELFGYERGAFTGAEREGKPGLFELAHKGTIFLDEVGDLSTSLQVKLLRVLQEKEVRRVGGTKVIPIDVRVIAATNKDLARQVKEGHFRSDLYYRINVLQLRLPPLRDRKEDIEELARHFMAKHVDRAEQIHIPVLTDSVLHALEQWEWPGNARELENFIERFALLGCDQNLLSLSSTGISASAGTRGGGEISSGPNDLIEIKISTLANMEMEIITHLLHRYQGNKNKVARVLGVSRTTLWKRLRERDVFVANV